MEEDNGHVSACDEQLSDAERLREQNRLKRQEALCKSCSGDCTFIASLR